MKLRKDPDSSTEWIYDVAPNGVGKLSELRQGDNYREKYEYDLLGRLTNKKYDYEGEHYTVQYSYDKNGRLEYLTYPNGFTLKYG